MIRPVLQPSPARVAPTVITPSLSASLVAGDCPHLAYVSVTTSPPDSVIVEVRNDSTGWREIAASGVTGVPLPATPWRPSRVNGLYISDPTARGLYIRARPRPGFVGDTVEAALYLPERLSAYLSGVAGYKATVAEGPSPGDPATCMITVVPGGTAHQVFNTDFSKFTGVCRLYVYTSKPTLGPPSSPPPSPSFVTDYIELTPINAIAGHYQGTCSLSVVGLPYVLPLVSWTSATCFGCSNAAELYPTTGGYPLVLQATAP